MKLVPNWREAWKWLSVHSFAILIALPIVWSTLPADVKAFIPDSWDPWIVVAFAAAGLAGRLIDQNPKTEV
jgi:polyferredoxin